MISETREALTRRDNVVMVRVNDETLRHLDALVESGLFKSRSESAAFLIAEGILRNGELFTKIEAVTEQIAILRRELQERVGE